MDNRRYRPPEEIVAAMSDTATRYTALTGAVSTLNDRYRRAGVPRGDIRSINVQLLKHATGGPSDDYSAERLAAVVHTADILSGRTLEQPPQKEEVIFQQQVQRGLVPIGWKS